MNKLQLDLFNWRLITLLNIKDQIYKKALQFRLQLVFMHMISIDQLTFLPNRHVLNNLFLIHKTIAQTKKSSQLLLFLKLDFFKIYDIVEQIFLFIILEKIYFYREFNFMIKLLFINAKANVKINGLLFELFVIKRGIR